jgi:hypothetical protein
MRLVLDEGRRSRPPRVIEGRDARRRQGPPGYGGQHGRRALRATWEAHAWPEVVVSCRQARKKSVHTIGMVLQPGNQALWPEVAARLNRILRGWANALPDSRG